MRTYLLNVLFILLPNVVLGITFCNGELMCSQVYIHAYKVPKYQTFCNLVEGQHLVIDPKPSSPGGTSIPPILVSQMFCPAWAVHSYCLHWASTACACLKMSLQSWWVECFILTSTMCFPHREGGWNWIGKGRIAVGEGRIAAATFTSLFISSITAKRIIIKYKNKKQSWCDCKWVCREILFCDI